MIAGLYTGATAMSAFETSINSTSNNIANVNTNGFKRRIVDFQDLVYSGGPGRQVGFGVRVSGISSRDFRQGPAVVTDNPTDLFIGGDGFFQVQLPNGEFGYTRDGSLLIDGQGQLVTEDGFIVQPPITFPDNTSSFSISPNGSVVAEVGGEDIPQEVGQIQLHTFQNPSGLRAFSRNVVQETAASGPATAGVPGVGVAGEIRQGVVEGSNVEIVAELSDLITAQRAFEANSRVVRVSVDMLQTAYEIVR